MLDSMLVDEQVAAHVAHRNVILRVIRPLPNVQCSDGVEHGLAGHSYSLTGWFPSSPFHDQ